ncbi:MAG: DoxX family membrane protein [Vicinamibacterales bacterium]
MVLIGYGEGSSVAAYGLTVLRAAVGTVFIAHGGQKLFGLWGGGGLSGTASRKSLKRRETWISPAKSS